MRRPETKGGGRRHDRSLQLAGEIEESESLPGSNRAILGAKELPFISQWVVGVSKTILKRDTEKMLPKVAESVSRRLSLPSQYLSSQQRVRGIGH